MSANAIPPCQAACPINTNVRGYVLEIARGNPEEAIRIIRQVNPFPSVCGRICTRPCESQCRRAKVDEAISIRALKRFAADRTKGLKIIEKSGQSYSEKVAIIGSGPAGLTAAHDLALLGYKVTVFEAQNILGGMLSEGIPDYRLPKDLVRAEIDRILGLGVEAKTGLSLGKDFTLDGLVNDYQAVFLAVGSQKSIVPKCHGADLKGIISGVQFLKQSGRKDKPSIGNHVVVVGGGHTAIDAARTCIRLGSSDVTVVYRRTLDEMPAGREEVEHAEREGIKFQYLASPVSFMGNGNVQKVQFIRMKLGEPDASGRRRPLPVENSEFEIPADTVILAIGYTPDSTALTQSGLEVNRKGTVIVKDAGGHTNIPGVFAAGDVVSGPLSVIDAIASGRRVAEAIHYYFRNLPSEEKEKPSALGPLDERVAGLINKAGRHEMPFLPPDERIRNFEEVDLGFDTEQAIKEAQRCLNCGAGASVEDTCALCLNCVRICPYGIPSPGKEIAEIDISKCQACGICATECPASAIKLRLESKEESRSIIEKVMDRAEEESPEAVIIGFYCQYTSPVGPPVDGDGIYWMSKFCTGRLDVSQIIYPFELGADGVAIHVCKDAECRFRDGSKWLMRHIKEAKKILDQTGIGAERLQIISEEDPVAGFINKIEALGINPVRQGKKVKT